MSKVNFFTRAAAVFMSCLLLAGSILTGCTGSETGKNDPEPTKKPEKEEEIVVPESLHIVKDVEFEISGDFKWKKGVDYGFVTVCKDFSYGFNNKMQYLSENKARIVEDVLFANAAQLGRMFGFDIGENTSAKVVMTRESDTITITEKSESITVKRGEIDETIDFTTPIQADGNLMIDAALFAKLLGNKTNYNNDTGVLSMYASEESAAQIADAKAIYDKYEKIIYDYSDVDCDKTGVGLFEKSKPEDRLVGIAYTTWFRADSPWGEGHTWDLPLLGRYRSDNKTIIKKHGEMLRDAGIDFVFVDWSNNTCYDPETMRKKRADFRMIEEATDTLFEVWSQIEGAPKIAIFVGPGHEGIENVNNGNHQRKVDQVYRDYVEKYPNMYFFYEGKPLLICYGATPTQYGADPSWNDSRFTVRWLTGYVGQQGNLFDKETLRSYRYWSWEERGTQTYTVENGVVEAINITASWRQQSEPGKAGYIPAGKRDDGATLKQQFQRANDLGAKIAIVVSFNEWTTGEQPSLEVSKDLEPSETYGSFYLDLLREQIKKFKGKI